MGIIISAKVQQKLTDKHSVSRKEVEEAFANRTGKILYDTREEHRTDPPTVWFVAFTNHRRLLKVCFIPKEDGLHIRTAYSANAEELAIYRAKGQPSDF
ncbi:ADP-ribosyl-(dinitrogen reductase) hydrolase [Dyella jiangningensis]|uniref:ADP-ribosyl-(Dinitrogen reductase) hydrolase n=1 Tax=Dyella jiangningensis TaxID=1379159 RepID=A0A328P4Y6_9GAMM|nr:ADP-ribosyl-(dinitrogen reductase) hydrolase [Dyella jiangningensis]RAO75802.1 ADP-ribosyl-(dinitrogen reductase) hydrolase [Dyella jiangningensis]